MVTFMRDHSSVALGGVLLASMGKFIVIVLLIALGYAWYKGWVADWVGAAFDSGRESVKRTQENATKQRPADPAPPEGKR
jgi:hypothetical protein